MNLSKRQTATVLHALRTLQAGERGRIEGCAAMVCEHFEGVEQLNDEEIDQLCDAINVTEEERAAQLPKVLVVVEGGVVSDVLSDVPIHHVANWDWNDFEDDPNGYWDAHEGERETIQALLSPEAFATIQEGLAGVAKGVR